ncbi:TMEM175 family protein [Flavobacterium sp. Arc2]
MDKYRLEMFSNGVLAIIITIMILEIDGQLGTEFTDLISLFPAFFSYILSFVSVGIYWKNTAI